MSASECRAEATDVALTLRGPRFRTLSLAVDEQQA